MTKGILSSIIEDIGEAEANARAESYVMVNVRPGDKVAVMLNLLSKLSSKTPSAVVTDKISRHLAAYAASFPQHAEAILEATKKILEQGNADGFQEGSALSDLEKRGIVKIETPLGRELRGMFKGR